MSITPVSGQLPTEEACISHLEKIRWKGTPKCPYCQSTNQTPLKTDQRYHCNICNTSFSVTVGTIFHQTHLPLQKWFLAVSLMLDTENKLSIRKLAKKVEINKNTACRIAVKIRSEIKCDSHFLNCIVESNGT